MPFHWVVVPDPDADTIALAELVLEGRAYRYATHDTTGVFRTEHPWPVEIDLPAPAARTARYRRPSAGSWTDGRRVPRKIARLAWHMGVCALKIRTPARQAG